MLKTTISCGNTKLGAIPNVSLVPGKDCGDVPCKATCYALKAWRQYPEVRKSWQGNSRTARTNPTMFFAAVREYLARKAPRFFRWHVAGDFLDQAYADEVASIAREFPTVKFLAFTKRHDLDFRFTPGNLVVVFSFWPGWGDIKAARACGARIAWMQDGTEDRVPSNAMECPGNCESCGLCWNLPSLERDVVFHKH
jgi:hypothetical protein